MAPAARKDNRLYIKVHHGMPEHPKVEPLSDAAFRLLVTAWCWCDRNRTDGLVPAASWQKRGSSKARTELVRVGLAEVTPDGVQMHDYLEHQRSAAEIEALSSTRRDAGKKGGTARATQLANAKQVLEQMPEQPGSKVQAETERERDSSYVDLQGGSSVSRENHPQTKPSPNCPKHPRGTDQPCGPCREARISLDAWNAEEARRQSAAASTAAHERAQLQRAEINRCQLCDDHGDRITTDGTPGLRCDHVYRQPGARARAFNAITQNDERTPA